MTRRGAALLSTAAVWAVHAARGCSAQEPTSSVRNCCKGRSLRTLLPTVSWPPLLYPIAGADGRYGGFLLKVLDELARETGLEFTFVVTDKGHDATTWVSQYLDTGKVDVLWFSLKPDLFAAGYATTHPVVVVEMTGLVYRTKAGVGLFRFLDPFTSALWLAIVGAVFGATVVMVLLLVINPPAEAAADGGRVRRWALRFAHSAHHAWSAMLGGDDYEWSELGLPGRVLRLGLIFFILISVSTYTANLAAFFTAPVYVAHGPQNRAQLASARACSAISPLIGIQEDTLRLFARDIVFPTARTTPDSFEELMAVCHAMLRNGTADIWIDPLHIVQRYYLANCADLEVVHSVTLSRLGFGLVLRATNRSVADNLSAALSWMQKNKEWSDLENGQTGLGRRCDQLGKIQDTDRVSLVHMSGLFIVCAAVGFGAVVFSIAVRAFRGDRSSDRGDAASDAAPDSAAAAPAPYGDGGDGRMEELSGAGSQC